jgi:N6-adenosine-specific RNA methylase IME4
MTVDEIAALPVADLAADHCHLHLWTTKAFMFECPKILDAWGFKYQGWFTWCKEVMGLGNCWRVSTEALLIAIRGEPRKFACHDLIDWAVLKRDEHSSKPGQVRSWIERASPGPYLELFARTPCDGWTTWGNEVPADRMNSDKEVQREIFGAKPYGSPSLFPTTDAAAGGAAR